MKHLLFWVLAVGSSIVKAQAAVKLPALVGNHMVLQRNTPLPIWGWADAGEKVTILFQGNLYVATPSKGGKWQVMLPPMPAGGPFDMIIQGQNRLQLTDILVGDVWLASGQSNMELPLRDPNAPKPGAYPLVRNAAQEVAQARFPQIRQFTVRKQAAATPQVASDGYSWEVCSPQTAGRFSAVAYFFARDLHRQYRVPIGIISSPWGGTPAEAWVSGRALKTLPDFRSKIAEMEANPSSALPAREQQYAPSALFNGMIAPLIPYALKGVIWYQGESNVGRATQYHTLFPTLIRDWRQRWGTELPFLFVQLANWTPVLPKPADSDWARLREAQMAALALPKTGMAVAIDLGEVEDIHPANKQDVGHRLALVARQLVYADKQVVAAGPALHTLNVTGRSVQLTFKHTGSGLEARGGAGALRGFAIAGADKQFHWAQATHTGNRVRLTSPAVANPVAVRYNWANNPNGNLYNHEGLPAVPFRTDLW